ncbi:MAG: glycosyltransferase family 9 protein [Candidatus Zhuqueibacterota bacterium]
MQNQFSGTSSFKILIIRMSSIGDIVLTTPVIRLLQQQFPGAKIDFVIKKQFVDILSDHPLLNRLLIFDKQNNAGTLRQIRRAISETRYDIIIDLHKNIRSYYLSIGTGAGTVARFKKGVLRRFLFVKFRMKSQEKPLPVYQRYLSAVAFLDIRDDRQGPQIFIHPSVQHRITGWYASFINRWPVLIGVAPGASFRTKRWTPQGFSEVINQLIHRHNAGIIIFGNGADRDISQTLNIDAEENVLDVTGQLSLQETTALLNHCSILLTNDTGLMHLATALKKKIVAIFGSTTEELGFFPYNTEFLVIQNHGLACRPCSHLGRQRCPRKHFKCMNDIAPRQVYEAVVMMMGR